MKWTTLRLNETSNWYEKELALEEHYSMINEGDQWLREIMMSFDKSQSRKASAFKNTQIYKPWV